MTAELQNHELFMRLQRVEALAARLLQRVSLLEDDDVLPWPRGGGEATDADYPFKLYIADGKLCCAEGNHYWYNSYSNAVDTETLSETGANSWPINAASTVYVQRTFDAADGSADVELVRTSDTVATVKAGQTATVMRFIIGTCTSAGIITQRWLAGDIDEGRVA